MEVCKRGLSCEHVIDSLHQDKKRHACIYGATCRIVESDTSGLHAQRFVHDAPITSAREVCKARANCAQLANRSHLLSHLHECARGVECVQVDPQHHFYFSHGGEVRPRVLCQTARCPLVNDAAHTALFMHVCSWGSRCNKQSQAAHVLRFMHPREYCPDRLSCTLIDVDQSHRSAFRHVCPAFGDCAKIKDPMHALRFAHPTLTSLYAILFYFSILCFTFTDLHKGRRVRRDRCATRIGRKASTTGSLRTHARSRAAPTRTSSTSRRLRTRCRR